ncbi:histidine kinase [Dactylosporangium sp. NPDC050588]|uniref:sensor histidine kinase n=1 Tax=Dactylosporangium sp. NPDC050588 TaxID=3157211 RepID=UPI0033F29FAC
MLSRLAPSARAAWITGAAATVALAAAQPVTFHLGLYGADNRPVTVTSLTVITAGRTVVAVGGLVAWARRPDSATGPLLVAWTLVSLSAGLGLHASGALLVWSYLSGIISRVVYAYALLTYPDGRPETVGERRYLRAIAAAPLLWLGYAAVTPSAGIDAVTCRRTGCPANPLLLHESATASRAFWAAQFVAALTAAVWLLALLFRRYRRMSASRRRASAPVLWAAAAPVVVFMTGVLLDTWKAPTGWLYWADHLTIYTVPLAMIVGLLASRLARADVAALLVRLRSAPVDDLRPGLAQLLGDSDVQIAIPLSTGDDARFVDPAGRPVTVPAAPGLARTDIGGGVLLLHHPTTRTEDPALFDAAVAAARLTLDNVRLAAQVRAQLAEVDASRERLVRTGDEERRRLERDLHDGAQQRLIGLGMALRSARDAVEDTSPAAALLDDATDQLRQSLTELRDLARGLRPALLAERGLVTAVQTLLLTVPARVTLTGDLPGRPDPATETAAFFVVAEALQNLTRHAPDADATVTLHAAAGRLTVTVTDDGPGGADPRRGTGLRGIADRVAAAGGHLDVTSVPGHGTTINADLPMHRHGPVTAP